MGPHAVFDAQIMRSPLSSTFTDDKDTMNEDYQLRSVRTPLVRRVLGYTIVLLVVFLLGFIPMWLKSRESSRSLTEAEQQLAWRMQNILASATIDARRGDYESARQSVGDFFTALRTEIDRGEVSALPRHNGGVRRCTQRDEMVTLLARGDPRQQTGYPTCTAPIGRLCNERWPALHAALISASPRRQSKLAVLAVVATETSLFIGQCFC